MNYLVRDRTSSSTSPGQVSHIDSMRDPYTDLEINCRSQLSILEACRRHNPERRRSCSPARARSTASPTSCPVDRAAPGAADRRQRHQQGGRRELPPASTTTCSACAPARCGSPTSTARASWSSTTARASSAGSSGSRSKDGEIQIYGDGSQLRDFVYVDDAADAFLRAGALGRLQRRGVQRRRRTSRSATATSCTLLLEVAGTGRVRYVEWPAEKKAIDIGSFYADSSKFKAADGLAARASPLREGLARTVAFYREHLPHYLEPGRPRTSPASYDRDRASRSCASTPGEDAAGGRRGDPPRRRSRLVRARPRGRGVRARVRRRVRRGARRRRRHRHRRDRADPARRSGIGPATR